MPDDTSAASRKHWPTKIGTLAEMEGGRPIAKTEPRGAESEKRAKAYILIRESVPLGFAVLAAAHASLALYLKFRDSPEIAAWLDGPFYKVVCKVSDEEFEKAKGIEDHVVLTESCLGNVEVALAFKPRNEWPKAFKFFRLYK